MAVSRRKPGASSRKRTAEPIPAKPESRKVHGHKLNLPDWLYYRLKCAALDKGKSASVLAAEILAKHLPNARVVNDP
jgi:hypothetical protein